MTIELSEMTGRQIVRIGGEVDMYSAPRIRASLASFPSNARIIVDLEDVDYIDSSGLGALISHRTKLLKSNGDLAVINPSSVVRKVFQLTRLDVFFPIFESMEEAMRSPWAQS